MKMNRRDFLKYSGVAGGAFMMGKAGGAATSGTRSQVALVKTGHRKDGVKASLKALKINPVRGKDILIKPNFTNGSIIE